MYIKLKIEIIKILLCDFELSSDNKKKENITEPDPVVESKEIKK
jgi:hypothetical protein